MKSYIYLLLAVLILVGCAKPPEQVYNHPKTGQEHLVAHLDECGDIAERFGVINMSPVHQYPMVDMKDRFQREKIFNYCMRKKGYEYGDSIAIIIDENNTAIYISDTILAAGETSKVTIAFSSPVGGLETEDFLVENGTVTKVGTEDGGRTWTAIFTPLPNIEVANNTIRLNNEGVIDSVSNLGTGTTVSSTFSIDTLRPSVEITVTPIVPDTPAEASLPSESDAPTEASVPVETDAPTEASVPVETDAPTEASVPVETDAPTEASVPVETDAPTEASVPVETDAPTEASLPVEVDGPGLVGVPVNFADEDIYAVNIHQTSRVDFTFSEPPRNFARGDITVINGTIGKLVRDDKIRYHTTFTANSNFKGLGQITVKASRFSDMARNLNEPATPGIVAINTLRPAITASVDKLNRELH
jgi:hypothetical protein